MGGQHRLRVWLARRRRLVRASDGAVRQVPRGSHYSQRRRRARQGQAGLLRESGRVRLVRREGSATGGVLRHPDVPSRWPLKRLTEFPSRSRRGACEWRWSYSRRCRWPRRSPAVGVVRTWALRPATPQHNKWSYRLHRQRGNARGEWLPHPAEDFVRSYLNASRPHCPRSRSRDDEHRHRTHHPRNGPRHF